MMKTALTILICLMLSSIPCAAHGIRIWLTHENGNDVIRMKDTVTIADIRKGFTKMATIEPRAEIYIGVQPEVSAHTVLQVMNTLRESGMLRITVYETHSSEEIVVPLEMRIAETNKVNNSDAGQTEKWSVEPAGGAYVAPGAGAPSAHP